MNILSIENKFKALDDKERKVRQFFNPKTKKGKKHHYISDIRADFQYDTLLYGLGMFWLQESEESSEESELEIQPVHSVPAPTFRKKNGPILAKRKNLGLLDLQKPLVKEHYEGNFSNTKYLNHDYLYKKPNLNLGKPGWKTAADGRITVKNSAARKEVMYSNRNLDVRHKVEGKIKKYRSDYPEPFSKEQSTVLTPQEFKKYLESCKEIVYLEKPQAKFELDLESLRKEPAKKPCQEESKLFRIVFDQSSTLNINTQNSTCSVTLTDISTPTYPTHTFQNLTTDNTLVQFPGPAIDLKSVFSTNLNKHTIRVLVQGDAESFDYYKSIQPHSENLEEEVKTEIIQYKVTVYTQVKRKPGQVVPLTLQNLHKPVPPTLPKIESKVRTFSTGRKKLYNNPITTALFTYKKNVEAFHPMAYPSNLSIFEAHDFIEENYPAPAKLRLPEEKQPVSMLVNGLGLNTSFLNN